MLKAAAYFFLLIALVLLTLIALDIGDGLLRGAWGAVAAAVAMLLADESEK